jgi:hypothetical protein
LLIAILWPSRGPKHSALSMQCTIAKNWDLTRKTDENIALHRTLI